MIVEAFWPDKFQLIGTATSLVFYGVNLTLVVQLLPTLRRARKWTTAATFISFLLVTAFEVLVSYITYTTSFDHRPSFESIDVKPFLLALRSLGMVATWVIDSFVLYQCFTVYSIYKKQLWVIALSFLFFLSSLGSGIYLLAWTRDLGIQVLPHFPLCLVNKFIMSFLIIVKLFKHRRMLECEFDIEKDKQLTRPYTTLIQILVQSYALHASFSLVFLVLYMAKHAAWRLVLPNAVQAGLLSHLLVRFSASRSMRDDSFNSEKESSSIRFSHSQSSQWNTTETVT
ncbi:hypothetical protein D9756_007208 [Leucocoprinus leucothites]|uniref:Uncharacterized protein n=1 Tax=Leucocoprinus leucothites TaxID=201217 RepID=A0A8H5D8R2_9AGAR|nr:hypothetical protein D9756_007208 [Leucoagaricus leucothites]